MKINKVYLTLIVLTSLVSLVISCSGGNEKKSSDNNGVEIKSMRLERLNMVDIIREKIFHRTVDLNSSEINSHLRTMKNVNEEIRKSIRSQNGSLNLKKYNVSYSFLTDLDAKTVKQLTFSDDMSIDRAILTLEKLQLYYLDSEYCNTYYIFRTAKVKLSEPENNLNNGDKVKFTFEVDNSGFRDAYFIGSKDSIRNKSYLLGKGLIFSDEIVLKPDSLGNKHLEGGVAVQKQNG